MPGAERIADHIKFDAVLKKHFMAGKLMAAICAAPAICFEPKGFLEGFAATAHPAFVDELGGSLLEKNIYADCRVVVDTQIVTSRGPGTALEWSLCLVEQLFGPEQVRKSPRHGRAAGEREDQAEPRVATRRNTDGVTSPVRREGARGAERSETLDTRTREAEVHCSSGEVVAHSPVAAAAPRTF